MQYPKDTEIRIFPASKNTLHCEAFRWRQSSNKHENWAHSALCKYKNEHLRIVRRKYKKKFI